MFYKYPEEFVVSVVYDKNLEFECNNENKRVRLLEDDEQEFGILSYEGNVKHAFEDDMTSENIIEYNIQNENEKNILNEIDNEYANSQIRIV